MDNCPLSQTNEVNIKNLHETLMEIKQVNGGVFKRIDEIGDHLAEIKESNSISTNEMRILNSAMKERIEKIEINHETIVVKLSSLARSVGIQWFLLCSIMGLIFWLAKLSLGK